MSNADAPDVLVFPPVLLGGAMVLGFVLDWLVPRPLLLPPLFLILQYGIVMREERYLSARFGPSYEAYRRRVRRWF